ncbi:uncharacterized protein PHACADRAFT_203042 [Phanerochaete carnosa HHB-10118-sp]|uniref:Uncharacterized protein n=1 Tax=Phanerochaete carnosa (strain HHB-10118-sp) TaxID=650164 RepID=K5VNT3_PHACS|nr:uncharacterized protein PHACADRAFT_203042 [Phanerochaete carnosa HHB-10118-sp]EKM48254.1 hypothetical protein PHACADRAFT_203042 [Phanerochaete carnosa HHB-10118-sp]
MSTQTISNSRQLPNSTTEANSGTLSHLTRQLSQSAKGFFSKKDEVTPTTPSQSSTPGTPAVGDVTGNPTSLQRFLSLGKTRKDGGIEFPPASWDTAQQEKPSEADQRSSIDEPASVEHLVDPAVTDSANTSSVVQLSSSSNK